MWDTPMVTQFVPQCLHFASRGAVAAVVEPRVASTHGSGPMEALEDVETFLVWLREKAEEVRMKLDRLVLGGAGGGAFLALEQALRDRGKTPDPTHPIPQALILFSSLVNTTAPEIAARFPDKAMAKELSPLGMVRRKVVPMIMFHGRRDRMTPFADVEKFRRKMRWRKNRVDLVDFEKAEHPFFNFNVSEFYYDLTIKAADRFLVDIGLLDPDPFADVE
jgi:acetyl esterase/lipase